MKYVVKLAVFTAFIALLYFTTNLVVTWVGKFIAEHFSIGNNAIYILHKLKICEAVNLYVSLVIGTWIANKIINFWGS